MKIKTFENWLRKASCIIQGKVGALKHKDYILPLIFINRLSDVFGNEIDELVKEYGKDHSKIH
ncbi:type I restriction-modification system subunit M N-terminal domain-containing protein [Caldisericum exile]|uniref:N6 adenine-specific DNA methyltransferase N-terminal domain-containing protein n=1 Tax=Caldisericum exile (strain DSM 21853 / NBRC 104410 / AZM16c01) TaxID=511051 RepID=A0A7U6GDW5_CALEA|nr:type I restriction-modification system subunit M N-terminal domain-containing protein [Caldisericum exile]BAL80591.1 hypothetical protein CSE_04650 [Caldisericum exile AZM16c01]